MAIGLHDTSKYSLSLLMSNIKLSRDQAEMEALSSRAETFLNAPSQKKTLKILSQNCLEPRHLSQGFHHCILQHFTEYCSSRTWSVTEVSTISLHCNILTVLLLTELYYIA